MHHSLEAIEYPALAVAHCAGRDMRKAVACTVFGVGKGQLARAFDHRAKQLRLLRGRARTVDQPTGQQGGQHGLDHQRGPHGVH